MKTPTGGKKMVKITRRICEIMLAICCLGFSLNISDGEMEVRMSEMEGWMNGIELGSWNRQSSNIDLRHGQHGIALSRLWLAAPHFKSGLKHRTRLGIPQTD
jgi:hypothetical protein